jgi:hypothetical protein
LEVKSLDALPTESTGSGIERKGALAALLGRHHLRSTAPADLPRFPRRRSRARIRALELVETFVELLTSLETDVQNGDKWLAELRGVLAAEPVAMPLAAYIKQIEEREVA